MAGVGAATIEGGVTAFCDALEVDAASVVYCGTAVRDEVGSIGVRDRCGGFPAERGSGICGCHLPLARDGVGVHACGLGVEATSWLRIPLYTSGGWIGKGDTAKAAHGLVCELVSGS